MGRDRRAGAHLGQIRLPFTRNFRRTVLRSNVFQAVADQIDLSEVFRQGLKRNDLLPSRLEDSVAAEVGKRFSEGLADRVQRGRYDPSPAEFIYVPKPGYTTRPAALLTLSDRLVYETLVEALRARIDSAMVGGGVAYWPRGIVSDKKWREFEAGCVEGGVAYVAVADVTGFYESIEHERLRETLVDLTGRRKIVDALVDFLDRVMGSKKGIPQGLVPSDAIATAYLTPLDHAMGRECIEYSRHGDDIRIGADSFAEARRNIYLLECELRARGLLLNASKATIMRADSYRNGLNEGDRVIDETRRALLKKRIESLRGDDSAISKLLKKAGRDDLGWDFFYHGRISFGEMVAQLSGHITTPDGEVAAAVFLDAMKHRLGSRKPLTRESFHHRVASSLVRLAVAGSPVALQYVGELLSVAPEKTELVANYLMAMPASERVSVLREVFALLESDTFRTAWEKAWLLRVVQKNGGKLTKSMRNTISRLAESEEEQAIVRVEAVKALAAAAECDRALIRRLWNTAPIVFHPDLVAAVHAVKDKFSWCAAFLDSVKDEPINVVVLKRLENSVVSVSA